MRSVLLGVAFLSACCATASAHGPGSHATPPTQEAIAAGDAARGGIAFEKVCSACHTIEKGARRRVGPNLFAVAGAVPRMRDHRIAAAESGDQSKNHIPVEPLDLHPVFQESRITGKPENWVSVATEAVEAMGNAAVFRFNGRPVLRFHRNTG